MAEVFLDTHHQIFDVGFALLIMALLALLDRVPKCLRLVKSSFCQIIKSLTNTKLTR